MTDEHTRPHPGAPTAPYATVPVAPGPRIVAGRYALLGELGRGGMGVVWRAQDQVIGRQVAIKELRLPDADSAAVFSERALREVRTGGRLNDPAVVTVYDVVTDGGTTFIVMELVDAPTLADLVRRNGPLPAPQVALIGERVLSALQAAHAAGIVHRDVKPANIMVSADGRVKLTDFGIAHAIDDPRLTTTGMIVGSPAFMAPERVQGREAMPESDLWSLGTALYFAVEGVVAFERSTTAATLHAIMTEVPFLNRGQGPLAAAILGLLVAKPEARLTAPQAQNLLAMASSPGAPRTPAAGSPMPTRVAEPPKKSRRGLWLALAALLVVGALVGGFFAGKAYETPAVDAQKKPTLTYGVNGQVRLDVDDYYRCYNAIAAEGQYISKDSRGECEGAHTLEVYEIADAISVASWSDDKVAVAGFPGSAPLAQYAEAQCALAFRSDLVAAARRSELTYRALVPTEAEWNHRPSGENGDTEPVRQVYCVLAKADGGPLTAPVVTKVK